MLNNILAKDLINTYGQDVQITFASLEKTVLTRAFLQPLWKDDLQNFYFNTSQTFPDQFLYISTTDIDITQNISDITIFAEGTNFKIVKADQYIVGDNTLYIRAVLEKA